MGNGTTIVGVFQKQCALYGGELAAKDDYQELTYAKLDELSSNFASYIADFYLSIYPDTDFTEMHIALVFERSVEMIVSMLAVLKLGGTFVPLTYDLPTERARQILNDCKAKIILTSAQAQVEENLHTLEFEPCVLDIKQLRYFQTAHSWTPAQTSPEQLAYIIYTSGTTGVPKGVCIEQGPLVRMCEYFRSLYDIKVGKRMLSFASYTFDASIFEIFCAILSGAALIIPPKQKILPGDNLHNYLKENAITHAILPPSVLGLTSPEGLDSLELVESAGEACTPAIAKKWAQGKHRFFNAYGPTEATICVSTALVSPEDLEFDIGQAIDGVEFYVIDENLNIIPSEGVTGELVIVSDGLARCYLNLPDETRKKFIFLEIKEGDLTVKKRGYRTGDLVLRNNKGQLLFRGRSDSQIKFRGYRIELSEIQSVINRMPGIVNSIARLSGDGEEIFLYFISTSGKITAKKIREHCKIYLPDYMLPAAYIALDEFPLTAHGKIDLLKLPLPKDEDYGIEAGLTQNLNVYQQGTLEIICSLLKKETVSLSDNFFDIGGHSLLMAQLILLLKEKFNISINIAELIAAKDIDALASKVESLSQTAEGNNATSSLPKIVHDETGRYESFGLTDIQQSYYMGRSGNYELSSVPTNIYREFDFDFLDVNRLEKALNKLVHRHDMLHAIVVSEAEQRVYPNPRYLHITTYDLKDATEAHILEHLAKIRMEYSYTIMPANEYPLFKLSVSILPNSFRLHLVLDAIMIDGWSYYIFVTELEKYYLDPDIELEPLKITFRDYVIAESKNKSSAAYLKDKDYWLEKIKTLPIGPELPVNYNKANTVNFSTESLRFHIDRGVRSRLKDIGAMYKIPESILLLSVFSEILNYWSGSDQFTINITLFNRLPVHEQVNDIIGDFTSLELLAFDHSRDLETNFLDRTLKQKGLLYSDLEHNLYSGIEIQRMLSSYLGKAPTGTLMPIVFTCFLVDNVEPDSQVKMFSFNNLVYGKTQSSQVWLDFKVFDENSEIVLEWDYVKELLSDTLINEMFNAYIRLLNYLSVDQKNWLKSTYESVIAPGNDIRTLANNCADETNKIPSLPLLHEMFTKSVSGHGDKIAVVAPNAQLSYAELDTISNKLANAIKTVADEAQTFIPILMENGIEQVIAMLGILKAGFAYVPINAHLPTSRIKRLLAKINSKVVITQQKFNHQIKEISGLAEDINILTVDESITSYSAAPLLPNKSGKNLAYGIFTSGTTGEPKLVMITHESVVNTITDINLTYQVSSQDTVFAISSYDFDLSVYDYFGLLATGGTIVLPSYEYRKDPAHWLELIQKYHVTIWNSVPMLMEMLLEYLNIESSPEALIRSLRLCLLSGDYIPLSLPDKLRSYFTASQDIEIISLGGATECSIWSISYPIDEIDKSWKTIPYGKALKNQQVYVLNSSYQLCPQGVVGDIFIAGMGLAQGYLNDEEKNKYHFINHPLTNQRMYRTGDLGRYFPNGDIEFLGRKDGQIKLSGHRIELCEIQHYLEKHPSVERAVLYFDNTNRDGGKIFAFVKLVNASATQDDQGDQYYLKHYLVTQLPEYMVPTLIMPIVELPLTTNGKIDNVALLKIANEYLNTIDKTQKPETEQAKQICAVWQKELKVTEIGLNQNLFELGATSITVTKMFLRLKDIINTEFALIDLFKYPTISGFINFINSKDNVMSSENINEEDLAKKREAIKERRKTLKSRKLHV